MNRRARDLAKGGGGLSVDQFALMCMLLFIVYGVDSSEFVHFRENGKVHEPKLPETPALGEFRRAAKDMLDGEFEVVFSLDYLAFLMEGIRKL